jgi:hypothetical protein
VLVLAGFDSLRFAGPSGYGSGVEKPDSDQTQDSDQPSTEAAARLRDAIRGGGELAGAAIGGAVGLVGGPPGAIGGAMAGVVITKALTRVGLEVHDRLLVYRQQERVGATLGVIEHDVIDELTRGNRPRDDGLFDVLGDGRRSDAEEVLEGILRAAADANQERKLRHLGAIFPSVAIRDDISASDAHWLARTAEQLSWRQMIVLSVVADPPVDAFRSQALQREDRGRSCASPTLAEEVEDLGRLGLLGQMNTDGEVVRAGMTIASIGHFWAVPMRDWRLTDAGALVVDVARLSEVGAEERLPVLALLLDQGSPGL